MMTEVLYKIAILLLGLHTIHGGYVGHPVGYSLGYAAHSFPFATPAPVNYAPSTYTAPLTPLSVNTYATTSHHTYTSAAPGPVLKYHEVNPFKTYSLGPSITKFSAIPSAHNFVPTFNSGPLSYELSVPSESFDGWNSAPVTTVKFAAPVAAVSGGFDAPRTVVKFGRPITTTTTTYSTGGVAAGVAAPPPQAYAVPFSGPVGW
ncbi:uncharacterized protein LOC142236838 [Haematobia irritans]|uniref:uncharacterized protein LOC142236463 n=1 Tax=Haematobia irritans TaxID=7368 RepID=UPI003F501DD2